MRPSASFCGVELKDIRMACSVTCFLWIVHYRVLRFATKLELTFCFSKLLRWNTTDMHSLCGARWWLVLEARAGISEAMVLFCAAGGGSSSLAMALLLLTAALISVFTHRGNVTHRGSSFNFSAVIVALRGAARHVTFTITKP